MRRSIARGYAAPRLRGCRTVYRVLPALFLATAFLSSCSENDPTLPTLTPTFSVSPATGNVNTVFTFQAEPATTAPGGSPLEVRWDWHDDGQWDTPFSTEKQITHRFALAGTSTVRMEMRVLGDITGSSTQALEVYPAGWLAVPNINLEFFDAMIATDNSLLVVGTNSDFEQVLLRLQGTTWTTYETRIIDCTALAEVAGELYANDGPRVVRWNGEDWESFGAEFDGDVQSLCEYHGQLYVAGGFQFSGTDSLPGIARWTGSAWSSISPAGPTGVTSSFMRADVACLVRFEDRLIVAGVFDHAGEREVLNVASWNGTTWEDLDTGVNLWIAAAAVHDGQLVVAGDFDSTELGIARWNGEHWQSLAGTGFVDDDLGGLTTLVEYRGDLVAAGAFVTAGGVAAANVARWSPGTRSWSPLGAGLTASDDPYFDEVTCLAVYNGFLYAGGEFTNSGAEPMDYIARWIE